MIRLRQYFGGPVRCRTIAAKLDAYVDGELSERERRRVAAHLAACPSCGKRYQELARQVGLIESLARVAPSADLRRRIMTTLPQRAAPGRARPRLLAWRLALAPAVVGVIIAAVLLLVPSADQERRVAPRPQPPTSIAQTKPAPPEAPATVLPAEEPAAPAPARPRVRTSPPQAPQPQPIAETETAPDVYRALGSEYEREGQLGEALAAYEQAEAEAQAPSLDSARVYEKMGYTADAVDRYADLAFAPMAREASNSNGG